MSESRSANILADDLTSPSTIVDWILPEFLPRGTFVALAGMPGAGKSYLSYYLGMAIASGIEVLGFQPPRPYRVLYFDEENSPADRVQYERWAWHGLGRPDLALLTKNFWPMPFQLGMADWAERAHELVATHRPELFIIDTSTPACDVQDENDNAEASRVIRTIRHLMEVTTPPATALVLKHAKIQGEDGSYSLRGAKAWMGQVDAIAYLRRHEGRPRQDDLNTTILTPGKTRAFGLRRSLTIHPTRTADGRGISLSATSSFGGKRPRVSK